MIFRLSGKFKKLSKMYSFYFLGCVINDSHSEIVARRCLILYLYKQMEYAVNSSEMSDVSENKSVLTKSNDGKYK